MKNTLPLVKLCLFIFAFVFYQNVSGQVTTATIEGTVLDAEGQPLPGANVIAEHTPSGSIRGVSTQPNGRFRLPNLRIGGPYTVTVTFLGFQEQIQKDIILTLGKTERLQFTMSEDIANLDEVVVTAGDENINASRTGAATTIDEQEITQIPTISRNAQDIYKLSPSADGNSFGGRNDQFNNFSLDGSIFNNPFGLDAATPGGQANAQPISLDAIEQIQVSVAPYDVTQAGFTGASVNAVTKSGTNTFKGSVFGFFRNESLTGSKVSGNSIFVPDLSQNQAGFNIGGPIIKDKLFFFANVEFNLRDDLGSNFLANNGTRSGSNVSRVQEEDLLAVSNILRDRFGYETGPFERYSHDTDNNKGIFKLDWNINQNNSLTATFNYLDAFRDLNANPTALGRRGPDATTLQFFNSGYRINNNIQSSIVELRSMISNRFSNKLQVGYTHFGDSRDPFSDPFPIINIAENGIRYIVAGHEPFSIHNRLDQKVFQATNNFDIFLNDHTVTVGTSLEAFRFDNSFNLGAYFIGQTGGTFAPDFSSVDAFIDFVNAGNLDPVVVNAQSTFENNNANNTWALAETNVGQWAFYAQDEWSMTNNFTLTVGLRMDIPLYFNTSKMIQENIERKGGTVADGGTYAPNVTYFDENGEPIQFDQTNLPTNKPLFSPRVGFNWNLGGENTLQLRGGSGLFTGRFPFVWIGNQVANPDFFFFQTTAPDFQFPQVWRSNLGVEKQFGSGWLVSSDLIYTNDINGAIVRNFGLKPPTGQLRGGPDNRAVYLPSDRAVGPFGGATNAYVFDNTDQGRTVNWTLEIKKRFKNSLFATVAYNFLDARDVNSIEAEISSDAFDRNPALGNVNKPGLAPSVFGNKHRIIGTASKIFIYGNGKWETSISTFYEFSKGNRFSYTYSGDANLDGSNLNDLIYIPTSTELETFAFTGTAEQQAEQRQAFENFIQQDDYLSSRRGQFAEKFSSLQP